MTPLIWSLGAFAAFATTAHVITVVIAIIRCRPSRRGAWPVAMPPVSIIRPVCGLENHLELTLRSTFTLNWPQFEIVFCVAAANDPALPMITRLIAEYPHITARLLVGNDAVSDNPKLNNIVKGWRAARHETIVIADSNVLMPAGYVRRLLAARQADTGLVCSPPIGADPVGFWSEVECAFLNTYQARWQYTADSVGLGFAQGKTMLWRRDELERAGGIRALASELAEDAAATKVVRDAGLRVRLVDAPFAQPLGYRSASAVWQRQVRWARLRRASFRRCFALEILSSGVWPLAAAALASGMSGTGYGFVGVVAVVWYGGEATLASAAGWHLSFRSPLAWLTRDLLLPALWASGWLGNAFAWRGNQMQTAESRGSA
jgi:ceramide glucosyltransferase